MPDPTVIQGEWLTGSIVAVLGAVGTFLGHLKGKRQGEEKARTEAVEMQATIKSPVPTVTTREEPLLATKHELNELKNEMDRRFDEIKDALNDERGIARTANGNIHKRIDALSERLGERLSHLEGVTDKISSTVEKLLDLALGKTPNRNSR